MGRRLAMAAAILGGGLVIAPGVALRIVPNVTAIAELP